MIYSQYNMDSYLYTAFTQLMWDELPEACYSKFN